MTANIHPTTGIAYGYISANLLDMDLMNELQMEGTDVHYDEAVKEAQREQARNVETQEEAAEDDGCNFGGLDDEARFDLALRYVEGRWEGSGWEQEFNDAYQPDEPIHEGVKDGVKYRTSWLGGALNVWVFESPHTGRFQACSPCVPGAANLDNPDEAGIEGYDVPPEWRDNDA